jgi:hypothetical protein
LLYRDFWRGVMTGCYQDQLKTELNQPYFTTGRRLFAIAP